MMYFLIYLVIPVYFSVLLSKNKDLYRGTWLGEVFFYGSYIAYIYFAGAWAMVLSYYMRYVILLIFGVSFLISFRPRIKGFEKINFYSSTKFFLTALFLGMTLFCVVGLRNPGHSIDLFFPLKGRSYILQGGNSSLMNHHFSIQAQRYALDILQLNELGSRSHKLFPKELDDFNIYGAVIYSPCNGIVIQMKDQFEDQQPGITDPNNPAGNYLVIQTEHEQTILLAHLLKGSVLVSEGSKITRGQPLAQVGNSGNTSEPHLHIHCLSGLSEDYLFKGCGVPMTFKNRFLSRNDIFAIF